MGELILGRKDDGTLEILRADDEITLDAGLLEDVPTEPGPYWLDNDVLRIDAGGELLAYVLTEHDRLTNTWKAVRTADRPGR